MAIVKFGDIVRDVKINVDRANNPYEHYVAGDHMDSEDLTIHRYGNFETDDVGPAFTRIFKPGQILYGSRRTYLKKVAVADFEGICANTTFVLESKDYSLFDNRLLPFIMLSDAFTRWSIAHSKGSTNPYVLFSDLADYEFDLPPIAEQKVLADKLWAAYRLKESYKKLLTATEEMVKSQFIEMFGTPENNHNDYPVIKIGEMVESINYVTSKPATDNGKYVYLRMNNITYDGKLDLSEVKRINLSPEEDDSAFVHKGDLMFNRTNTKEFVGKTTVFNLDEQMVVAGYIIKVRFKEKYSPEYVSGYLNSTYGKALLRKMAKGAVHQANINAQEFQGIQVLDVPKQEQDKYVTIAKQADKSGFELRKSIVSIDKVIKSLINENI